MTVTTWRRVNLGLFALLLVTVLLTPRLPFQDYPNWIYQGDAYHWLLTAAPSGEAFEIRSAFVPNSTVTVILGCLDLILPPDLSGRLLVAFILVLTFVGLRQLFRGVNDRAAGEPLALILSAHLFLFYGFLSFSLGLALVFLFITKGGNGETYVSRLMGWTFAFVLLYYTHFLAFGLMAGYALVQGVLFKERRRFAPSVILPALVIPAVLFALYVQTSGGVNATEWSYSPAFKAGLLFKSLAVAYAFNDTREMVELTSVIAVNAFAWLGLLTLVWRLTRGRWRTICREPELVMAIVLMLVGFAMPYKLAGVYYLESRFYFVAVVLALSALLRKGALPGKQVIVVLSAAASLVLIGKSAMTAIQGYNEGKFERSVSKAVGDVPYYSPVMLGFELPEYYPHATGAAAKLGKVCPMINCRNQVPLYAMAARRMVYPGMFETGLLSCRLPRCDARLALEKSPSRQMPLCRTFLFVSPPGFTAAFRQLVDERMTVIAEDQQFILAATEDDRLPPPERATP